MQAFIADFVESRAVEFSNKPYMQIFFSGCDFKCPYCNTPELLETKFEHEIDLREIKKIMENQKGIIEGIIFTGGEPCFQRSALIDLAKKAKETGFKTILDTNGSKPEVIEALLKNNFLDTIMMDLKAPFNEQFDKVTRSETFFKSIKEIKEDIKQSIEILKAHDDKLNIVFKTLIVPGLIYRKEDLMILGNEIEGLNCTWELKAFKPGITLNKEYRELESPSENYLENLREIIRKEFKINCQ